MTDQNIPIQPPNSFRVTLVVETSQSRMDQTLMESLRAQDRNLELKNISRSKFKDLFHQKRIQIKGQTAKPSSSLAKGITYVDILGFKEA